MKFGIRELMFVLLLIAIPGGAYLWVFKPTNQHIESQRLEIEAKEKKLVNLQKAMVGMKDLNEEVERLQEAVSFFEKKLPDRHEIHKVLEELTKIREHHGLLTSKFETLKTQPFVTYSEQPIRLKVYGNFEAYYQFLLDVEKMDRITKIRGMHLQKVKADEGLMEASVTMSIFFDNSTGRKQG